MRVRTVLFLSAVALSLMPGTANAAESTARVASSTSSTSQATLKLQTTTAQAAPAPQTCHIPGCIEAFWKACDEGGGFTLEDPVLNSDGTESGAAEMDCL